jgi:hypothetical protein
VRTYQTGRPALKKNPSQANAGNELDFVVFNWKSVFAAGALLAVIFLSPFSSPLSISEAFICKLVILS